MQPPGLSHPRTSVACSLRVFLFYVDAGAEQKISRVGSHPWRSSLPWPSYCTAYESCGTNLDYHTTPCSAAALPTTDHGTIPTWTCSHGE
ncbi:hypothetical protein BDR07DRAFT_146581 [Suillus spraguei]|nr:hypothetical protein BDR07DRAFT_146581 [Suillus spraguei]